MKYTPMGFGTAGVPDLLVCYKGRFLGLEVKNANGTATDLQAIQLRLLREAGAYAEVVRSVEDVEKILDEIDGADRES